MNRLLRKLLECTRWHIQEDMLGSDEIIVIEWADEKEARKLIREYSKKKGKANAKR